MGAFGYRIDSKPGSLDQRQARGPFMLSEPLRPVHAPGCRARVREAGALAAGSVDVAKIHMGCSIGFPDASLS